LQDESVIVEELVEYLYKLAKRGEVPQFFLHSIQRFRRSELSRQINQPGHRPQTASGGMASSRAATRVLGHSKRAERVLR
jgi:ribosomal protein L34E